MEVLRKLAAARARLVLERPFLGALVLRLPLVAADPEWCPTTATDARVIYYSEQYITDLSLGQVQFALAHEALHCGLSHFARRERRHQGRWDVACDLAINPLLVADDLEMPPGALHDAQFTGFTAEEIYPRLSDDEERDTLDRHLYNEDQAPFEPATLGIASNETNAGAIAGEYIERSEFDESRRIRRAPAHIPPPLNKIERERLAEQWQQRLASAAQNAATVGKLSAGMKRILEQKLKPTLPWRAMLDRYLKMNARDDYNYMRLSSRREGDAILPTLRSQQANIVIALDTSGSIEDEEITEFANEINAIKGQLNARITLLSCATELAHDCPWTFEPWETLDFPDQIDGGGGTNFVPVFEWIKDHAATLDLLIYFTDAKGEFPIHAPNFPTLWLVKGQETVPWGGRIQLN